MSKKENEHKKKAARLTIKLPTGETEKHKLNGVAVQIGSGPQNKIRLSDSAVANSHAMFVFDGEGYSIVDLGEGDTLVNGDLLRGRLRLSHGDVMRMGESRLTFKCKQNGEAHESKGAPDALQASAGVHTETVSDVQAAAKDTKNRRNSAQICAQPDLSLRAKAPGEITIDAEDKKKKDKKAPKEKKDERVKAAMVRAWGGIAGTILSVALTITISIIATRHTGTTPGMQMGMGGLSLKKLTNLSESRKFSGGQYEASGAVAVPDANAILFVDDSEPNSVFFMQVNELGEQEGAVKAVPLGVSVINPEGITQFGSRFMIAGSLSTHESNETGGLAIFDFDPQTQTVSKATVLTGMRKFLFDNVPELKSWANKTSAEGGLNVEGIAVDPNPQHPRVLLGLRGPVLNGNALIVPIRLRDRLAAPSIDNLVMDEANAIELNLNGQAIRDFQYDSQLGAFLIISGAPETEKKTDFALWQWNGEGNQSRDEDKPKQQSLLSKEMKPEGVAPIKVGDHEFVFIVGDASRYAKIEYAPR